MNKSPLLVSILAALSSCSTSFRDKGCMEVKADAACPADVQPSQLFLSGKCGDDLEIDEVLSAGSHEEQTFEDGTKHDLCCYTVEVIDHDTNQQCDIGRPYFEQGRARRAPVREGRAPGVALAPERAAAWARAGAEEHASVAAFSRLSLELMALGAPSELLRAVHRAALEEIGHAERCFELAKHFGGSDHSAGAFPFTEAVRLDVTLGELARAAVREGCLGETLGAYLAQEARELAPEPEIKAALAAIAREEAEHAVLSYRIVAWALREGGASVKAEVEAACAEPWPRPDCEELALRAKVDARLLRRAAAEGARKVIAPAMTELLRA